MRLLALSCFLSTFVFGSPSQTIFCDIMIVGGGQGGLHTAYQLSKVPNQNICLIEKEDHLGGRLYDVALDPARPDLLYGTGALRVMESQTYVLGLAQELNIQLELAPYRDDLINSRGFFSFSSDELKKLAYTFVTSDFMNNTGHGTEDTFYDKLLHGPERQHASEYPDFRS